MSHHIDHAPVAMAVVHGPEYKVEFSNKVFRQVLRVKAELGGCALIPKIDSKLRQTFKDILDLTINTGVSQHLREVELELLNDGNTRIAYFAFRYDPLKEADNDLIPIIITGTEVTEQVLLTAEVKQNATRFRQLADLMPAKISNANASGEVIYFNKEWLTFAGMGFEDLRDFGYHKMMHPDEVPAFQVGLYNAAMKGIPYESEMRFKNTNGEYIWHNNIAAPIKDINETVIMWVGVTTDIHQHKAMRQVLEKAVTERTAALEQANLKLQEQNQALLTLNKELESFAYISSHDLQEPLRKIQAFSSWIVQKEVERLSVKGRKYFTRITDAASRMQLLINDLLIYAQLGQARTSGSFDVKATVDLVLSELEENIVAANARIVVCGNCSCCMHPTQLGQVLHNLLGNAIKFVEPGTPPHIQITITSTTVSPLGDSLECCHICIADNGIGFESTFQDKIFEVFQRLNNRDVYEGTGIGLAIVKKIVEQHHGKVFASGIAGAGAIFDIYIPRT
jgi:PAS domain S-box-containing protein